MATVPGLGMSFKKVSVIMVIVFITIKLLNAINKKQAEKGKEPIAQL